jgi:peptide/nickel transport system substrate-binding protein
VVVALAALSLGACGSSPNQDDGADAGPPVYDGTLRFYDPVQYDAWQITNTLWSNSNVTTNLVDRLVWQDPKSGDLQPWLATKWELSPDRLTYVFHLRDGVTFSDHTKLDAQVVKDNLDQHGFGDKALGIAPDQFFGNYRGTTVVDPLTVSVSLGQPNAGFLQALSIYRTGILAESYLKKNWNDKAQLTSLVGSGPFVVSGGNGTTSVTLTRRDDYGWAPAGFKHQGKAYLKEIDFTTVPEASTLVGALQSGQADVSRNIRPDDEATVTGAGDTIAAFPVQGESNGLHISLGADAPTQDPRVRLALQSATDRSEIDKTALSPSYPVAQGILVHGTPNWPDGSTSLGYDLDKARGLLDQAGWQPGPDGIRTKDGKRLAFTLYVTPYYQVSQGVVELLQSQWKKAGVEVTLKTPSLTEYEAQLSKDVVFQQSQTSRADDDVLRTSLDSTLMNTTYSTIPDLDRLVRAQAVEFDPAKRAAAVKAIQDYVLDNALVIPLYDETQVFGLRSAVHGFTTEAVARAQLYDTWVR